MKKFALVGCGEVAVHHAKNILRAGKLVAVCDIVPEKADAFAITYAATAYYNLDDLLAAEKEVDVVVICTPNGFHAEHIIKSLQARKHVLCESPLCLTTAAAWQIIETEKFCRRRLFVANPAFHHPLLQKLKTTLEEGRLGRIYSFQLSCLFHVPDSYISGWRGTFFPGGGLLYTSFSQYVDALVLLFGEVVAVQGFKRNAAHQNSIETEDSGTVALQMQDGVLGTFHWSINAAKNNQGVSFTIVAEGGTICIAGEDLMSIQYPANKSPLEPPEMMQGTDVPSFREYHTDYLEKVYDELSPPLHPANASPANAFAGLKTIAAIEKIYKALSEA